MTELKDEEPIVFYSLPYYIELGKVLANTDRRFVPIFYILAINFSNMFSGLDCFRQIAQIKLIQIINLLQWWYT